MKVVVAKTGQGLTPALRAVPMLATPHRFETIREEAVGSPGSSASCECVRAGFVPASNDSLGGYHASGRPVGCHCEPVFARLESHRDVRQLHEALGEASLDFNPDDGPGVLVVEAANPDFLEDLRRQTGAVKEADGKWYTRFGFRKYEIRAAEGPVEDGYLAQGGPPTPPPRWVAEDAAAGDGIEDMRRHLIRLQSLAITRLQKLTERQAEAFQVLDQIESTGNRSPRLCAAVLGVLKTGNKTQDRALRRAAAEIEMLEAVESVCGQVLDKKNLMIANMERIYDAQEEIMERMRATSNAEIGAREEVITALRDGIEDLHVAQEKQAQTIRKLRAEVAKKEADIAEREGLVVLQNDVIQAHRVAFRSMLEAFGDPNEHFAAVRRYLDASEGERE